MDAEDDERPHVKFRHEDTDGHYAAPQETGTAHCADDALVAALERVRIGALVAGFVNCSAQRTERQDGDPLVGRFRIGLFGGHLVAG